MISDEELRAALSRPHPEDRMLELKSKAKLLDTGKEATDDIAAEICALANRFGGSLIFGLTDEGRVEGKGWISQNVARQRIEGICEGKLSPSIKSTTELWTIDECEIVVVDIPARTTMPHAIVWRKGENIKRREYYIRTDHGKRLVSDHELLSIFRNPPELETEYRFFHAINLTRSDDIYPADVEEPGGSDFGFSLISQRLTEHDRVLVNKDSKNLLSYSVEIMPFVFLRDFGQRVGHKLGHPDHPELPPPTELDWESIQPSEEGTLTSRLDFFEGGMLRDIKNQRVQIPKGMKLEIKQVPQARMSVLTLTSDLATLELQFKGDMWSVGICATHPRQEISMLNTHQHVRLGCLYRVRLDFPNEPGNEFSQMEAYARLVKKYIEDRWDYQRFLARLPDVRLFVVERKIDEILKRLPE